MGTSAVLNVSTDPIKRNFPLVARANKSDLHVLFCADNKGTVIVSGGGMLLGEYNVAWESCFKNSYWTILDSVTITFKS